MSDKTLKDFIPDLPEHCGLGIGRDNFALHATNFLENWRCILTLLVLHL